MRLPERVPGWRLAVAPAVLALLVWLSVEGGFGSGVWLAWVAAMLVAAKLAERRLGARRVQPIRWAGECAVLGGMTGAGAGLLALGLAAVKTGLHGHGPELTPAQLLWLWQQIPIWTLAGTAAGLGISLLLRGWFGPK